VVFERMHGERARAESFGAVAERYERFRPSYPDQLIDDLVALGARDVIDVACGTGKAGRLLAARGLRVHGVELDAQMAAVARTHGMTVDVDRFETWDARGRQFDLLVCGQGWHWLDPVVAVGKAAAVVRPGVTAALFWNWGRLEPDVQARLHAMYRERAPQLAHTVADDRRDEPPFGDDLVRGGQFTGLTRREYLWECSYSTEEWVQMVLTHSDHLLLDAATSERVADGLREVLDAAAPLRAHYSTYAVLARVPSR
jgi:SAM-dependent methyltransferase